MDGGLRPVYKTVIDISKRSMDISKEDQDRVCHVDPTGNIRITKFSTDEEPSPQSGPCALMDQPIPLLKGSYFYKNSSPAISAGRRFRGEHPYLMRSPAQNEEPNVPPNNIPPLMPIEDEGDSGPRPLLSDDVIQKLRESLRQTTARHEELCSTEWECEYEEGNYSPQPETERMTYEEYLEEEEKTKQTIDEIIMVAQALRDKIQREEEMRRAALAAVHPENSSSRAPLLGAALPMTSPQPKIPSLLDLHVEPPEEILIASNRCYEQEYRAFDFCWNCDRRGHRFTNCKCPKMRKFCYRCGKRGYDLASCPICKLG